MPLMLTKSDLLMQIRINLHFVQEHSGPLASYARRLIEMYATQLSEEDLRKIRSEPTT